VEEEGGRRWVGHRRVGRRSVSLKVVFRRFRLKKGGHLLGTGTVVVARALVVIFDVFRRIFRCV